MEAGGFNHRLPGFHGLYHFNDCSEDGMRAARLAIHIRTGDVPVPLATGDNLGDLVDVGDPLLRAGLRIDTFFGGFTDLNSWLGTIQEVHDDLVVYFEILDAYIEL